MLELIRAKPVINWTAEACQEIKLHRGYINSNVYYILLETRVPLLALSTYCSVDLIGRVYLALNLLILLNGKFRTHKMVQSFYWNLNCNLLCNRTVFNMAIFYY